MTSYLFDTYAIFEILNGNERYKPYASCISFVTRLNLFELYYNILREHGKGPAEDIMQRYANSVTDFDEEDIRNAAHLKLTRRKLSMADCIGYAVSQRLGIRFLTGDKEFEGMEGVEWVK
jgi:uncharacterized protein